MAEELKGCPFCGDKAKKWSSIAGYYVQCEKCDASGGDFDRDYLAITAWNTRHDPADHNRAASGACAGGE